MMKKTRSMKERILALTMAMLVTATGILPTVGISVNAAENEAMPIEAQEQVSAEFIVEDESGTALSGCTITIKDASTDSEVAVLRQTNAAGKYVAENLMVDTAYKYEVVKNGYEYADAAAERTFTAVADMQPIKATLKLSDIQLSKTNISLKVSETAVITVENPVDAAVYTWSSDRSDIVSVENGTITAVAEGTANITAAYGGKTASVAVTVSKHSSEGMALSVTPAGGSKDVDSVTCKVTGLAEDATDMIKFYINDAEKGAITLPNRDKTWSYGVSEELMGNLTFKAVYSGDGKYEGAERTATVSYNKTLELQLEDNEAYKAVIAPDAEDSERSFVIPVKDSTIGGRTLSYVSDNTAVAVVDNTGTVTAVGTGKATITVSAATNTNYAADEFTYEVVVQEKIDVNALTTWASYTKIYDGKKEVILTAVLPGSVVNVTEIIASFEAEVDADASATAKDATIVSLLSILGDGNADKDLSECYVVENVKDAVAKNTVTINQRVVYLGTNDLTEEITYGADVNTFVESKTGLVKEIRLNEANTGVIKGDTVAFGEMKATTKSGANTRFDVGTHADEIIPDMKKISDTVNYKFVSITEKGSDAAALGDFTVSREELSTEELLGRITWSAENGTLYTEENNKVNVWISDGTLKAAIASEYSEMYDQVIFRVGRKTYDLAGEGYNVSNEQTGTISGVLYLAKNGKDKNKTNEVNFTINVDKNVPEFTFGNWEQKTAVVDNFAQAITFNRYANTTYSITSVKAEDNAALGNSGVPAPSWKYHVYEVTGDEEISEANLLEYIENISWITPEAGQDYIDVVTLDPKTHPDVQGNYIVLVKVTDNVGNSAVYSSNGIVIEVEEPEIKITEKDGDEINHTVPYSTDVDYKVNVTDGGTTSGISSVVIEVLKDGKVIDEETKTFDISKVKSIEKDGEKIVNESELQYTLEELADLAVRTYGEDGSLKIANGYNSNNMAIQVTAYDQAGNSYTEQTSFMVDAVAPVVEAKFDIEPAKTYEDAEIPNYFNAKQTVSVTVTYTEKNFHKNGVTFDVYAGADYTKDAVESDAKLERLTELGIEWEWLADSEADKDVSTYTDGRTNTLKLTFNLDNEYYILPKCTDLSGRVGEAKAKLFIVDKTAPAVTISYTAEQADITSAVDASAKGEDYRYYSQPVITATLDISEKNFYLENGFTDIQMSVEGTKLDKNLKDAAEITVDAYKADVSTKGEWGVNGTNYTNSLEFLKDANYTFAFQYEDLAGNPCVYMVNEAEQTEYVRYFTVDNTVPTGTVAVDEQDVWTTIWQTITFNIFKNTTYDVKVTAADATAGIKYAGYYKSTDLLPEDTDFENIAWKEYKTDEKGDYIDTFEEGPNQQFVIYQYIVDKAGNQVILHPTDGAIADDKAPVAVDISIANKAAASNDIFNEDVQFKVEIEDPLVHTFSGIKKVWYTVTANNNGINKTEEVVLVDNSEDAVQREEYRSYTGQKALTFTVDAETYNCNDVEVKVFAVDFSDNRYESNAIVVDIDVTNPEISVAYNAVQPLNGKYYKDTRVATVTIKERNFDKNLVNLNITNSDGTPATISWSTGTNGVSDSTTHTATLIFAADGDYKFTVDCTDLAGNKASNPYTSEEFTIDKTLPIINVSYDNNSAQNGNYYKAARTATITITEHNFNAGDVKVMTTASNGSAPGVRGWSSSGDRHTATVYFGSDADYTFDISYADLAGNTAADYQEDKFTVDLTNPVVEITGVADKSANKGVVAPVITINDTNFNSGGVTITLSGAKNGTVNIANMVTTTTTATGQVVTFSNFANDMDDVYTLTAKSVDRAGNETPQSIMFSVNRRGSAYDMSDETKELLDKGYTNSPVDIVVYETNVDTLEFIELSYTKDGEIVKLIQGTDYSVKSTGEEGQWKQYTYTIFAECFEEEGKYNINISSVDRAENESNNKVQSKTIEFTVDKTAPTMAISNLEDRGRYDEDKHEFTLDVKDNTLLSKVELYLDDKLVHTYEGEELVVENGKVYISIEGKDSYQTVKLVAYDEAGNPTEPVEYSVLVTANGWVQFVANKPVFYGSIAAVAAIAAFIFFIIWKKKKDKEEKNAAR